jgi:hypothetical protein
MRELGGQYRHHGYLGVQKAIGEFLHKITEIHSLNPAWLSGQNGQGDQRRLAI